ncbi:MAG TPA: rhodanese-like domain-containing protein [Candidatus Baltobacteraceae bacterium]|jgi:thiosulfate/3-mercaptopyruvate sulfurtransferase|nr:rhodanese-like domain-containing protein [Candidatus Baltobacteraceae bacterium]
MSGEVRTKVSDVFVESAWLKARLDDPSIRIVDTRSKPHGAPTAPAPSGREQFAAGHLPGAIHLDYADDLSDPATPYATRVAPADFFAEVLGKHGIGDAHRIIVYDAGTVPYAARFVWMCRYYGHDDVAILAGGLPAWIAAGGAITKDLVAHPSARFTPHVRPELRASREEVLAVAQGRGDAQLIETQRDSTYATRDRDIAGAIRLSGNLLLEDENGGRIAPRGVLDKLVAERNLDRNRRTIVSCGSGVSASGSYLALLSAGFQDVAVYDGSWLEWNHDGLPTVLKTSS